MASRDMPWLKWYPYKAQTSFRWRRLTLAQRGLFHELYDLAAMADPRGQLRVPDEELARALNTDLSDFGALLAPLLNERLIIRDDAETLIFPDFSRHQRNGPLRIRRASGAPAAHNWPTEGEVEGEGEEEGEKEKG